MTWCRWKSLQTAEAAKLTSWRGAPGWAQTCKISTFYKGHICFLKVTFPKKSFPKVTFLKVSLEIFTDCRGCQSQADILEGGTEVGTDMQNLNFWKYLQYLQYF